MFCLLYVCCGFLLDGCYHASTTVKEPAVTATLSRPGGLLQPVPDEAGLLREFRERFHRCLTARGDALFCLADAVLCAGGRVTDLARRWLVAALPLPRWPDGRIRLAADVTCWLRPAAVTSAGRLYCHVKNGKGPVQMIPGWQYSLVAALSPGP